MSPSAPRPTPSDGIPDKLAALLDMGFERVQTGPLTAETVRIDKQTHKVSQILPAMGSFVSISVLHQSRALAEDAIGAAYARMDRLVGLFNRFDGASPITHLNETGRLDGAPAELAEVVARGLGYYGVTYGAFDITVKPLVDLFRDPTTYEETLPPDGADLRAAHALLGAEHIRLRGRDIGFRRDGMGLTLDGIAKGYIVDAMAGSLAGAGASRFLINAGGDIRTAGDRGDARPWTVAVRDPDDRRPSWDSSGWGGDHPDVVTLRDGAVATSGSYEVYFDRERLSHHIVNGGTGRSPARATSVTVTAPTTMEADALATAVFVLGPRHGTRLIEGIRGCECLIIDRQGKLFRSSGWRGASST